MKRRVLLMTAAALLVAGPAATAAGPPFTPAERTVIAAAVGLAPEAAARLDDAALTGRLLDNRHP